MTAKPQTSVLDPAGESPPCALGIGPAGLWRRENDGFTLNRRSPMPEKNSLFLVGRIDKRGRRIVFVNEPAAAPFPGPWELQAVFTI